MLKKLFSFTVLAIISFACKLKSNNEAHKQLVDAHAQMGQVRYVVDDSHRRIVIFHEELMSNYNTSTERSSLKANCKALIQEHNTLMLNKYDELVKQHEALQIKHVTCDMNDEASLKEHEQIKADYEQILAGQEKMKADNAILKADYEKMLADEQTKRQN